MVSVNADNILSQFDSFELYDEEFEAFFLTHAITRKAYAKGEIIAEMTDDALISYLHKGQLKLYTSNADGNEVFNGFLPQYSIMIYTPGLSSLGKYSVANAEAELLYAPIDAYLAFLAQSPQRILHQLKEPYYRRNLNDLPRYEAINQSSRLKTYVYLRYLASRFGKPAGNSAVAIYNPPTNKDIAHFNDIHPNNVVTFFNDLKRQGIIAKDKNRITILDITLLDEAIDSLKK